MNVRTISRNGEQWASIEDIRAALNDREMILRAAAMLKVAHFKEHHDEIESLAIAIAFFFTEATGVLRYTEN